MSVYKRKSGRWAVLIELHATSTGLRNRRSIGTYDSRKAAERAEREALGAHDRGIDVSPQTVTVTELLTRYLVERELLGRSPKTMEEYESINRRLIVPHLGGITLAKLRPAHIADWIATILQYGSASKGALSPKSVRHAIALLSGALRWAVKMQLVERNGCNSVTAPRVPPTRARGLSDAEADRLLQEASGTRWEMFMTVALLPPGRDAVSCAGFRGTT